MTYETLRSGLLTLVMFCFSLHLMAQQSETYHNAKAGQVQLLGKTKPLKESIQLFALPNNDKKKQKKQNWPKEIPNFRDVQPMRQMKANPLPLGPDPLVNNQLTPENSVIVEPLLNFDGLNEGNGGGVVPPDPVGFINEDFYLQMVNGAGGAVMRVFDKDGAPASNPIAVNTLWTQFNTGGLGDPIVLWDQEAGRWLVTELSNDFVSMLIAVSETSDPLGSYYTYRVSSTSLPDYPKFGIWQDAYYITTNEGSDPDIPVYVMKRDDLLNGVENPPMQKLGVPKFNNTNVFAWQVASAADWDGALAPPAGSPQYVLRIHDDAWGFGADRVEIWEVSVDFDNASNSTVTGPIELPTAPFDATLCPEFDIFNCIDQGNGNVVAALQHTIMFRTQYRNFGNYETMVLNFSVDVTGGSRAGIRWMELRKNPGEQWTIYQEGTYAPDNLNRFMGSIAIDGAGNIALGYSAMGPNAQPGLRFTGRRVSDPLGEMTVQEYEIVAGENWNPSVRHGDYSAMSVDPSDERTFWFTGEYTTGNGAWGTRIASFVINRDTNDMSATGVLSPVDSELLTDSETVTATFRNIGINTQSNFEVGLMVDGTLIGTKIVTESVQQDSSVTVVFDETVDMSIIKSYEFKVFSSLEDDGNILNDTFRTVIAKLPRFDAAIASIAGFEAPICQDNIDVSIELTNVGVENLTSAEITWSYNGGAPQVINWTGDLASGAMELLPVSLTGLLDGENTIEVSVAKPNGMADENMSNDAFGRTFNAFVDNPKFLNLEINFDNAPQEVTWTLTNENDFVIYSGGPYPQNVAGTTVNEQLCIVDACYTFTMFDSGNDGLCCNFGDGSYRLIDENEVIVAQGAEYGSQNNTDFCVPFVCFLNVIDNVVNESAPGAGNGVIFLSGDNGLAPLMYSIDGGQNFSSNGFFGGLSGGTYSVVVVDAQNCVVEIDVLVGTCAIDFSADITGASSPSATDGSVLLDVTSGVPPFTYNLDGGPAQDSPLFENLGVGTYLIEVSDNIGCSKTLTVEVDVAVSIEELSSGQLIRVSPNPTEGIFNIEVKGLDGVQDLRTEIIDVNGKVIERGRLARFDDALVGKMSLHVYPPGVYFVRFLHPELNQLARIVRR
ncbi:MAG: T9SS type A sorting domain-containing protein [Bacteroidota bacterium]